eukprot:6528617-Prymnesium_polylepis.2
MRGSRPGSSQPRAWRLPQRQQRVGCPEAIRHRGLLPAEVELVHGGEEFGGHEGIRQLRRFGRIHREQPQLLLPIESAAAARLDARSAQLDSTGHEHVGVARHDLGNQTGGRRLLSGRRPVLDAEHALCVRLAQHLLERDRGAALREWAAVWGSKAERVCAGPYRTPTAHLRRDAELRERQREVRAR